MIHIGKKIVLTSIVAVLGISLLIFGVFLGNYKQIPQEPCLIVYSVDTPILEIPMGSLSQADMESSSILLESLINVKSNIDTQQSFYFELTNDEYDQIGLTLQEAIGFSPTNSWYVNFEGILLEVSLGYIVYD